MWIDFKSWYIYQSIYNLPLKISYDSQVVNWFQILVYLSKYLQQPRKEIYFGESCELISNLGIFIKVFTTCSGNWQTSTLLWIDFKSWYIYQSIYNRPNSKNTSNIVVNWFQILVYLSKYLQLIPIYLNLFFGCELISNLGIFIKVFTTSFNKPLL